MKKNKQKNGTDGTTRAKTVTASELALLRTAHHSAQKRRVRAGPKVSDRAFLHPGFLQVNHCILVHPTVKTAQREILSVNLSTEKTVVILIKPD